VAEQAAPQIAAQLALDEAGQAWAGFVRGGSVEEGLQVFSQDAVERALLRLPAVVGQWIWKEGNGTEGERQRIATHLGLLP